MSKDAPVWDSFASGWGVYADIQGWQLFVTPNRPGYGYEAMILVFNHVLHRLTCDTQQQAQNDITEIFISLLDEWKRRAEQLKESTK